MPNPFTHAALGEKLRDMIDARSTPARVLVVEDETLIQMRGKDRVLRLFEDTKSLAFVSKPYTAGQLCAALRAIGIY